MLEIRNAEFVNTPASSYAVITISSTSGNKEYRVDVTNGRCSCPSWKFGKVNSVIGRRTPCKHLVELGYKEKLA